MNIQQLAAMAACSYIISILLLIVFPIIIKYNYLPPYNNLAWLWMIVPIILFLPVLFIITLCDRVFNSENQKKYNYIGFITISCSLILLIILIALIASNIFGLKKLLWCLLLIPAITLLIGIRLVRYKSTIINRQNSYEQQNIVPNIVPNIRQIYPCPSNLNIDQPEPEP